MICQLSADRFEYKQPEPFVLCPQRISFESQPIQRATPTGLKALFTGQQDALNDLRPLRDRTLDQLYSQMRERGTRSQTSFLERFLNGRDQARRMGNDLGQLLEAIPANPESSNGARDQIIAAVALAQLNACPVIVISIPSDAIIIRTLISVSRRNRQRLEWPILDFSGSNSVPRVSKTRCLLHS